MTHSTLLHSGSASVLLDVWREACRHIDIAESTRNITQRLLTLAPVGQLLVRRIDRQRLCIETVALGTDVPDYLLPESKTVLSAEDLLRLDAWSEKGSRGFRFDDRAPHYIHRLVVPSAMTGEAFVGALRGASGLAGALVVVAEAGQTFHEDHTTLMEVLLEPFSTAVENDARLREISSMRAAAEADKQSLLTKLGRKELTDAVIGADAGLRGVMERVQLVARSDIPVLILGETGAGKEVVARLIHTHSPRSTGPFLRVNCGAIPMELIDSQLFGHEKGAFTGAVENRQGWFERADGGTLLLDEIGELPLAAQVRLLRILQDGWLERVGGREPMHVNVRVVAATHRDLGAMVSEGKFREDLWYRIAVFPVLLPPLRERLEDVAELARHFAKRAAARFGLPEVMPKLDEIALLQAYHWPGNIRELAAVIDRAALLGNGQRLEIAKSLGVSAVHPVAPSQPTTTPAAAVPTNAGFPSLHEAMKRHIETALTHAHGRIEGRRGAAAILKVNPHTLRARMRKLGIDWARFREDDTL